MIGITDNEMALLRWMVSGSEFARILSDEYKTDTQCTENIPLSGQLSSPLHSGYQSDHAR